MAEMPATAPAAEMERRIHLNLVSHTNAGKTTLARTLLGRDIGTVRDEAHVTELAEAHTLLETAAGDTLVLWDTPGFGDSARLLRRLKQSAHPLGWLLGQVWDRLRDRPLWCSQQAVRNVRESADVVLYLVNAAEDPAAAGYVDAELQILAWTGRPVLLLLNQVGPPRPRAEELAEEQRWHAHVAGHGVVRGALTLDAFSRCWVQEVVLARAIGALLPAPRAAAWSRLQAAWEARGRQRFDAAMAELAAELARAATDRAAVAEPGLAARSRELLQSLVAARKREEAPRGLAMQALSQRRADDIRATTDRLIALHGLAGHAATEILEGLAGAFDASEPVSEGYAALLGGVVTGALGGLKADIAAGGLTFGAGTVLGGLLGALGGMGLARGYNLVRGRDGAQLRWSHAFLDGLVQGALLRYLSVAHFGRGRGEFVAGAPPGFWREAVAAVVGPRAPLLHALWDAAEHHDDAAELHEPLRELLDECGRELLDRLYPDAMDGEG